MARIAFVQLCVRGFPALASRNVKTTTGIHFLTSFSTLKIKATFCDSNFENIYSLFGLNFLQPK